MSPETFHDLLDMEAITADTCLEYEGGRWKVGGVDCLHLAEEFGTPLFVLSGNRLRRNCGILKSAFGKGPCRGEVRYAVKANSDPNVLAAVAGSGFGAEVASSEELWAAREAGIRPGKILFNGNAKTDAQLREAVGAGIQAVVADCRDELVRLDEIAAESGATVPYALRINSGGGRGGVWEMTGPGSKFGTPQEEAIDLYRFARSRLRHLEAVGIHCHAGSQNIGEGTWISTLETLVEMTSALAREGTTLDFIDVGGGFPVPSLLWSDYTPRGAKAPSRGELAARFDMETFGRRLLARFGELCSGLGMEPPLLIVEPGGWLVKDSGLLLTTVQATKPPSRPGDLSWAAADAGCHTLPDCWIYDWFFECLPLDTGTYGLEPGHCHVAGPLCDPGDVIARDRRLPPLKRGDVLAFLQTGGYQSGMQSSFHLLPPAPVVFAADGRTSRPRPRA